MIDIQEIEQSVVPDLEEPDVNVNGWLNAKLHSKENREKVEHNEPIDGVIKWRIRCIKKKIKRHFRTVKYHIWNSEFIW